MSTEEDALYKRAEFLRAQNPRGAVEVLEELIVRKPDYPNALNLAGWLLATRLGEPISLSRAVQHLGRAVELFPADGTALANLVETLLKADRPHDAVAAADAALARNPLWVEALNVSGWLKAIKLDRLDEGLAELQRATQRSPFDANANFNLGLALRKKGDAAGAFAAFRTSTIRGSWRDHEAHLRVGEGHEQAGRLRRALGAYRQAARLDGRGEYTAFLTETIDRIGNTLLQRGQFFLHADDEERYFQYLRREYSSAGLKRVKASTVAREAQTRAPPSKGLEIIAAHMNARALLPKYSDQSPRALLGADPSMKDLLDDFFAVWIRLYDLLLDAEEPESDEPRTQALRLAHEQKFAEAAAQIDRWERGSDEALLSRAAFGELIGDVAWLHDAKDAARALYALSVDAYGQYAAGSTSGGEGHARMQDVNRLRAKLG